MKDSPKPSLFGWEEISNVQTQITKLYLVLLLDFNLCSFIIILLFSGF